MLIGPDFKPFYAKDQGKDLGIKTWKPDQWKMGGGTIWGWVSYDPELNLIYYGTGNPGVWNPDMRPGRQQMVHHYLGAQSGDRPWRNGPTRSSPTMPGTTTRSWRTFWSTCPGRDRTRKLLLHPGRTGFVFVLDRENGELLSAEKFVPVNWATATT